MTPAYLMVLLRTRPTGHGIHVDVARVAILTEANPTVDDNEHWALLICFRSVSFSDARRELIEYLQDNARWNWVLPHIDRERRSEAI